MSTLAQDFFEAISDLCGRPIEKKHLEKALCSFNIKDKDHTFGHRQLNEVLLLCNERIVSKEFFKFLANSKNEIKFMDFKDRVNKFRKLAMLKYGSFRFAFNYLCNKKKIEEEFEYWIRKPSDEQKKMEKRHKAIREISKNIAKNDLYLLGHLSNESKVDKNKLKQVRDIGKANFETYLSYDYLDVYVATSMRKIGNLWRACPGFLLLVSCTIYHPKIPTTSYVNLSARYYRGSVYNRGYMCVKIVVP